ncbi:hypothetical protein [Bdellovibrio sp. HCB2-146]|uniref:hypothetical protein n=1 Tax=Bdellovibrio sp. HCB2-146 TaxID=3394362 RepID=UPI0039BCD320
MMKKTKMSLLLLALGIVTTQAYQNCAPMQMNDFSSTSVEAEGHDMGSGSGSHPVDTTEKPRPSQKQLVVNKTVVAGTFREIFTSTKYPITNLEGLIDKWVLYKGAQFGGACNYYTSYSGRDCSGSTANTNLNHFTESNTVRESFHVQLCENVLGVDAGVHAALEKIGLTSASAINTQTLSAAYGLFYRAHPPTELEIATLLDLNTALTAKSASPIDKWRAALSQICESPAWQLF